MALIGNQSVLHKSAALFTNGTATAGAYAANTRANMQKRRKSVARFQSGIKEALPAGYAVGNSIMAALSSGRMAAFSPSSSISVAVNLAGGRNLEGSAALSIIVADAQLDQIVSLIASASSAIAKLDAILAAAAGATASSTMTISVASAICGAIFSVTATGAGSVSPDADLTALAHLEAEAGGPTALSPEGLANAVLDALLADHTVPGSVGEALGNVGASSNPWSALLAANNSPGSFGERIQKLLTTSKFLGLK